MAKLYEISLNRHQTGMTYDEYSMLYINYHAYIKKLLNYRNYKHYNNHFILDSKDLMMVALKYGDLVKAKRIRSNKEKHGEDIRPGLSEKNSRPIKQKFLRQ